VSPLLDVRNVTVRYGGGAPAVDDVSFACEPGAFIGIIGPNGAGKTTLIDALTGFVASEGSVTFDGRVLDGLPPHRRYRSGLARTFQSLELFDDLTVESNVAVATNATVARNSDDHRQLRFGTRRALEMLELEDVADRYPPELPLGQRKLVTVARGLASHAQLLLLDEPAAGLDTDESVALGEKLRRIAGEGTTLLLVDHDLALVASVCERLLVLDSGRLIADGPPGDVLERPEVVAAYIGTVEANETVSASPDAGGDR
jgi:branched-chain amino acid transport system ATP-binding protein